MKSKVDFSAEFVNDERVIGRWEVVDIVAEKDDFMLGKSCDGYIFLTKTALFLNFNTRKCGPCH